MIELGKRALGLLIAALAVLPAVSAEPRLEAIVPEGGDLALLIEDFPALRESWSESPLARTWEDPQVRRFFAPLLSSLEIDDWERMAEQEIGHSLSEVLDSFDGQMMLIVPDLAAVIEEEETGEQSRAAILARVGNRKVARAFIEHLESMEDPEQDDVRVEPYEVELRGETLHLQRTVAKDGTELNTDGWAIVDGFLITGGPESYLRELVAAVKKGSVASALGDSRVFETLRKRVGDYDVVAYLDARRLGPLILEQVREESEQAEQPPGPAEVDPVKLVESLSLEQVHGLVLAARVGERETRFDFGLLHGEEKGLLRLLAYRPGPVRLPDLIPDDVLEVSVANFSIASAWAGLIELLEQMNPMVSVMLGAMREHSKAQVGFDPLEGLIGALGEQLITAKFLPAAERPGEDPRLESAESLFGISVDDRQALEMAVEGIKTLAGGGGQVFERRDYLGHTIYTFKLPLPREEGQPEQLLSYAITDRYLLIGAGSARPIQAVLGRLRQPGRSLWDRDDVKAALKRLPEGASGFGYSDVSAIIVGMFDLMARAQLLASSGESEDDEAAEPFCDPGAKPDARILERYFDISVSGLYKSDGLLHVTSRMLHPRR